MPLGGDGENTDTIKKPIELVIVFCNKVWKYSHEKKKGKRIKD